MSTLCLLHSTVVRAERIAVFGGGISGTFVSRYLTDYDQGCNLEELTLYDPGPIGEYVTQADGASWQGSRVATLKRNDGRIVELGASIISDKFELVKEMAASGNLSLAPPFATGMVESNQHTGFLLYHGNHQNVLNTANMTDFQKKVSLLLRYNIDFLLLSRAMRDFITRFEVAQSRLLEDDDFFFESPEELWKSVGLEAAVTTSLAAYCRGLWVPEQLPWWRNFSFLGQGALQEELLAGINLVNYNQDNRAINALSGIASFSLIGSPPYSIRGGNVQLISSAWDQAQKNHCNKCNNRCDALRHVRERVATVVGSLEGFEVFGENGTLIGTHDIVIMATPLSMSKIDFYVKSNMDASVLQEMPLGKLIEVGEDAMIPDDPVGQAMMPRSLPPLVVRPYQQVVTTLVSNGVLQADFFSLSEELIPKAVYMTAKGKAELFNITAISEISSVRGIYKIFSNEPLPHSALVKLLGSDVTVEMEKVWGGRYGGATPDYRGNGESTEFLLFDGASGFHGHTKLGALYYTNAMEHTLACMETSAMGAKAVAKLVAKRLDWRSAMASGDGSRDEL